MFCNFSYLGPKKRFRERFAVRALDVPCCPGNTGEVGRICYIKQPGATGYRLRIHWL